jgi:hypothetical protein
MSRAVVRIMCVPAVVLLGCGVHSSPRQQTTLTLPVYRVTNEDPSEAQLNTLAAYFHLPRTSVSATRGMLHFVDAGKYLSVPEHAVVNNRSIVAPSGPASRGQILATRVMAFDVQALSAERALSEVAAYRRVDDALGASGLLPPFATRDVAHSVLTMYSTDRSGDPSSTAKWLDTQVDYQLSTSNQYLLIGPGAQIQFTFDSAANVTRLLYARRGLLEGESVRIIPERMMRDRLARNVAAGAKIALKLVYWSPPFRPWWGTSSEWHPSTIIPWYAYYTIRAPSKSDSAAGRVSISRVQMVPATDDKRFVPTAKLFASATGAMVRESVSVTGGQPPYTYIWSAPASATTSHSSRSIVYQALAPKWVGRRTHGPVDKKEVVAVTVIDGNGVTATDERTVSVQTALGAPQTDNVVGLTYGIESPSGPKFSSLRAAWSDGMASGGAAGGTMRFDWEGADAWPGDFIEPNPPGALVDKPWAYGDADYSNWGVNSANLVIDIADGLADEIDAMQPNVSVDSYPSAALLPPTEQLDVAISGDRPYSIPYAGSWGPDGVTRMLYWLLLDDCNVLYRVDASGVDITKRWGAAIGGLHVLAGFSSPSETNPIFESDVALNLLGTNDSNTALSIVQSWFDAAKASNDGTPVAMGPALRNEADDTVFTDFGDHYTPSGPVGPTITPHQYPAKDVGWWTIEDSGSSQFIFPDSAASEKATAGRTVPSGLAHADSFARLSRMHRWIDSAHLSALEHP